MSNNDILPGFDRDTCDFLTISLQKIEGVDSCLALRLKGQIDTYSSSFLYQSARKVIDAGFIRPVLVLIGVDYVSSKAVGAFVQIKKAAKDKGGEIALVDIHPRVMEVFKNLRLDKFLCCEGSFEEAVARMRGDRSALQFSEAVPCPSCERKLRIVKSGRFRCPKCMAVLAIDDAGMVRLGET
jgi:anti-anti-sigma factor